MNGEVVVVVLAATVLFAIAVTRPPITRRSGSTTAPRVSLSTPLSATRVPPPPRTRGGHRRTLAHCFTNSRDNGEHASREHQRRSAVKTNTPRQDYGEPGGREGVSGRAVETEWGHIIEGDQGVGTRTDRRADLDPTDRGGAVDRADLSQSSPLRVDSILPDQARLASL
jgi:hypothetical protein